MIYNFDALSSRKQLDILLEGGGIGGDDRGQLAREGKVCERARW